MNFNKILPSLIIIIAMALLPGCKEYNSLDSITISPIKSDSSDEPSSGVYVCDSGGDKFRKFKVTGTYDDDDTEDLSSEVTWEADTSGDAFLSDTIPGLVNCSTNVGVFGILATYTFENGVEGEGEETNSTKLTDDIIIEGK